MELLEREECVAGFRFCWRGHGELTAGLQLLGVREVGRRARAGVDRRLGGGAGGVPRALPRLAGLPLDLTKGLAQQIDRKEDFYQNYGLTFPHQDGPEFNHSNTVLDGEMVIDVDPDTGDVRPFGVPGRERSADAGSCAQHMLRLLAFDLLVCDSTNLMAKPLSSRYGVSST